MKKILVPTDFSKYAENAARVAAQLAKKENARIYFLHVVSMPIYETGIIPGQTMQDIDGGLLVLKHVKKKFKELFEMDFLEGISVVEAIEYSGVFDNINELAKKHEMDIIVMGSHGTTGFINDYLIGSNADKVVRLSETPVLVVNDQPFDIASVKRIVFASDFEQEALPTFDVLYPVMSLFDAEIELLRVVTRDDFYFTAPMLEIQDEFAKLKGLKNYKCHVFNAASVQEGINEFAKVNDAQLIVTITHGRRGLARLLNGSVTKEVLKHTSIPLLSAKATKN